MESQSFHGFLNEIINQINRVLHSWYRGAKCCSILIICDAIWENPSDVALWRSRDCMPDRFQFFVWDTVGSQWTATECAHNNSGATPQMIQTKDSNPVGLAFWDQPNATSDKVLLDHSIYATQLWKYVALLCYINTLKCAKISKYNYTSGASWFCYTYKNLISNAADKHCFHMLHGFVLNTYFYQVASTIYIWISRRYIQVQDNFHNGWSSGLRALSINNIYFLQESTLAKILASRLNTKSRFSSNKTYYTLCLCKNPNGFTQDAANFYPLNSYFLQTPEHELFIYCNIISYHRRIGEGLLTQQC